jgi:hypothetical protein
MPASNHPNECNQTDERENCLQETHHDFSLVDNEHFGLAATGARATGLGCDVQPQSSIPP